MTPVLRGSGRVPVLRLVDPRILGGAQHRLVTPAVDDAPNATMSGQHVLRA